MRERAGERERERERAGERERERERETHRRADEVVAETDAGEIRTLVQHLRQAYISRSLFEYRQAYISRSLFEYNRTDCWSLLLYIHGLFCYAYMI